MIEEHFDKWDRKLEELFDRSDKKLDEMAGEMRVADQRASSLEQHARQSRLAMVADGQADTKTRKRTEGAATAVQAMHGDSFSANRVDPDPMCSTSFGGDSTGLPALPCSGDDTLVGKGAAAPKSCFSLLEVRTTSAAGGLLPTGKTSTATKTTFDHPTLWFCLTEETNFRNSILHVSYFSNYFGWINKQKAPFWPRVNETKSGQNRMFDPGGSRGRLGACLFLGTWRALFCGEVLFLFGAAGDNLQRFLENR